MASKLRILLLAPAFVIMLSSACVAGDGKSDVVEDAVEEYLEDRVKEEIKKRLKKKILEQLKKAAKNGSAAAKSILKNLAKAKKFSNPADIFLTVMEPTTVADGTLDPNVDYSIYSIDPPDTPPVPPRKPER